MDNRVDYHMARFASSSAPMFEDHKRGIFDAIKEALGFEPYVKDYVSLDGNRMALTASEARKFVPIEFEMCGSDEAYRPILHLNMRDRA